MAITIIILCAVVIGLVYRCLIQARRFDNVHDQLLDAETERLAKQSALHDCEKNAKLLSMSNSALREKRDEVIDLAERYSNALGRSNSKLNDIETAVTGIQADFKDRAVTCGVEVVEAVEKIKSILEV